MQRLKYRGITDTLRQKYEIQNSGSIKLEETFEGYLISSSILYLTAQDNCKVEIRYYKPGNPDTIISKEIFQISTGEKGYLVIDTPYAEVSIVGKCKVTLVGLQRNY